MAIAMLLLSGCLNGATLENPAHPEHPTGVQVNPKTFVYECGDTFSFVARIESETAWLFLPQTTLSLPRVVSASGEKYSDGITTFWTKADAALLEYNDTSYRNCMNNRTKAIWEHAKLNGVDFRAIGNEPGWYLEIRNGDTILFVGDYGNSRYEFAAPEPETNQQERRTIYRMKANGKSLTVIIEGRQCRDSMSGESFGATVSVTLDQKKYQGCGRALH